MGKVTKEMGIMDIVQEYPQAIEVFQKYGMGCIGCAAARFENLEAGAIDALAVDIGVASYQIASRGEGFTILEQELASEQYGIGFLLGNEALKDAVEGTLMEMVEDGTFAEIVDKYSDYGMSGLVCLE